MESQSSRSAVVEEEVNRLSKLHPTPADIPSCTSLLDDFLSCHVLVPQLRAFYRYGRINSCDHKWDDFKFCISNRNLDEEDRRAEWIKRRAEWWADRRLKVSSDQVWDARREQISNFPFDLTNVKFDLLSEAKKID